MSTNQLVASIEETPVRKPSILLVDILPALIGGKSRLRREFEVIQAANDAQAWDFISRHGADLVLYSLGSDGSSELELLQRLRAAKDSVICYTPFLVVANAKPDPDTLSRLLSDGVTEVIVKPGDDNALCKDVSKYLRKSEQEQTAPALASAVVRLEGFSNQGHFIHDLRKELSFAIRNKNELALMLLKLDQFEAVLDQGDEQTSEKLLTIAAGIIQEHTHIEDKLAYFGDGVFAILLPAANVIGTRYLGKRLLSDFVDKQFRLGSGETTLSVSIGVSAPEIKPGTTFSEILGLAENRLHVAIESGGKRVVDHDVPAVATMSPVAGKQNTDLREMRRDAVLQKQPVKVVATSAQISQSSEANTWREQARQLEAENHKLQAELNQTREQLDELEELRSRLQESDGQQQETLQSLEELSRELERMRLRATNAELVQERLLSAEHDQAMIQQHLLEEYERTQQELMEKNQQIERAEAKFHQTEQLLINIQHQLEIQQQEYEFALQDERTLRLKAEDQLAVMRSELEQVKGATDNPESNSNPNPLKAPAHPGAAEKAFPSLAQARPAAPARLQPQRRSGPIFVNKSRSIWPFRLAMFLAIAIVTGSAIYLKESLEKNLPFSPGSSDMRGDQAQNTALTETVSGSKPSKAAAPDPQAIVEAERRLKDTAETEFQRLLYQQADVKLSITDN